MSKQIDAAAQQRRKDIAFAAGLVLFTSAGYVLWNIRTLYMLASLLTATGTIRRFDPLAILDVWEERKDDDESLQSILDRLARE